MAVCPIAVPPAIFQDKGRTAPSRVSPAESQARRPQHRAGLRGPGPAALTRPPPLPPRRLCLSRGARSIGPRTPGEGGVGEGRRGHPWTPGTGPGSREGAVPPAGRAPRPVRCPPRPGPAARRLRGSSSRSALAPEGRWPRPPPSWQKKVPPGGRGRGAPGPGAARQARSRAPTFRAGRHRRAPSQGVPHRNHRGEEARWVASGQGERI